MAKKLTVVFRQAKIPASGNIVVLVGTDGALGNIGKEVDARHDGLLSKSIKAADFKGSAGSTMTVWTPGKTRVNRCLLAGVGKPEDGAEQSWLDLGGVVIAALSSGDAKAATILLEDPEGKDISGDQAALVAMGMTLRAYKFDQYMTGDKAKKARAKSLPKIEIATANTAKAKRRYTAHAAVAEGVNLARDLVNEPANILGPVEFANRAKALSKLGVDVQILNEKDLSKLKMNSLLSVSRGSVKPARLAVMRWNGAKTKSTAPVAFVGKGVVFDTGGISLKPGAGMGDMKGDMGGAAAVTGLMHALAARKARVNAVGVIGLVENMPDGDATRPGDIIKSMSGQTIEVLNTDAEGRLVLADALWYTQKKFKPKITIDLATLTGAILVALGQDHAGLFSNDDELSTQLAAAGEVTGEKVWRMPLGKTYDKMIDSKFADMKNIGGRWAGSITAAQFLKRYVNESPWAHLDIAGTAMNSPDTKINRSWGSGFGVRLLDRLVADNYEK